MNKLHNEIGEYLRQIHAIQQAMVMSGKPKTSKSYKGSISAISVLRAKIEAITLELQKGKGW